MNRLLRLIFRPYIYFRDKYIESKLNGLGEQDRFALIYKMGYWKGVGDGSLSGAGSDSDSTYHIRRLLPVFLQEYNIKSILDVPCGDFYWMKDINLDSVYYYGGDIVPEIAHNNSIKYGDNNRVFDVVDIVNDQLMVVDLVFSRDCFVHLTDKQIKKAIANIIESNSKYLMTTSFPTQTANHDSTEKDRWRPINLQIPPFNLPEPMLWLDDSWDDNSLDATKKMGVWKISDLQSHV